MLKENTGKAMMDSGDFYGRHWQKNQNRDFENEKPIKVSNDGDYLYYSKSLYHFLNEHLKYDPKMTQKYNRKYKIEDRNYSSMDEFAESLHDGKYPESVISDNSYNSENTLDQDIQYAIFTYCDIDYIGLQIHGGCDVRGGYTDPVFFTFTQGWDYFLLGMKDIFAKCKCEDNMSDDCGYNWQDEFSKSWIVKNESLYCLNCQNEVDLQ